MSTTHTFNTHVTDITNLIDCRLRHFVKSLVSFSSKVFITTYSTEISQHLSDCSVLSMNWLRVNLSSIINHELFQET